MTIITLNDLDNREYDFICHKLLHIDASIDDSECIYFYSKQLPDDKWLLIYLESTRHLKKRIHEYIAGGNEIDKCIRKHKPTHIFIHKLFLHSRKCGKILENAFTENYHWVCKASNSEQQ